MDEFNNNNDNIDNPFKNNRNIINDPLDPTRPKPKPNPLDDLLGNQRTVHKSVNITLRFECPECGGRFAAWDSGTVTDDYKKRCPFCLTEKGDYGEQRINELKEENERLSERVEELEEKLEEIKETVE